MERSRSAPQPLTRLLEEERAAASELTPGSVALTHALSWITGSLLAIYDDVASPRRFLVDEAFLAGEAGVY